ncbi:putative metal homeostasis protein [Oenococcus alcoholitolerans]|uniref:putative metal homeostasis protein n=1 Tax=Oenococcus alcoholitolerans TaxID=931074 RepID=UPI003F72BB82
MEKTDLSSAYRRLKKPNIKTRKRALKIIREYKRQQALKNIQMKELLNIKGQ